MRLRPRPSTAARPSAGTPYERQVVHRIREDHVAIVLRREERRAAREHDILGDAAESIVARREASRASLAAARAKGDEAVRVWLRERRKGCCR